MKTSIFKLLIVLLFQTMMVCAENALNNVNDISINISGNQVFLFECEKISIFDSKDGKLIYEIDNSVPICTWVISPESIIVADFYNCTSFSRIDGNKLWSVPLPANNGKLFRSNDQLYYSFTQNRIAFVNIMDPKTGAATDVIRNCSMLKIGTSGARVELRGIELLINETLVHKFSALDYHVIESQSFFDDFIFFQEGREVFCVNLVRSEIVKLGESDKRVNSSQVLFGTAVIGREDGWYASKAVNELPNMPKSLAEFQVLSSSFSEVSWLEIDNAWYSIKQKEVFGIIELSQYSPKLKMSWRIFIPAGEQFIGLVTCDAERVALCSANSKDIFVRTISKKDGSTSVVIKTPCRGEDSKRIDSIKNELLKLKLRNEDVLIRNLSNNDFNIRLRAIETVGMRKMYRAANDLLSSLNSSEVVEREAANYALQQIFHKPYSAAEKSKWKEIIVNNISK